MGMMKEGNINMQEEIVWHRFSSSFHAGFNLK
jgi:hypothetical protein